MGNLKGYTILYPHKEGRPADATTTGMGLENSVLSERSQSQNTLYYMSPFM